jgi:hypothetical protein
VPGLVLMGTLCLLLSSERERCVLTEVCEMMYLLSLENLSKPLWRQARGQEDHSQRCHHGLSMSSAQLLGTRKQREGVRFKGEVHRA